MNGLVVCMCGVQQEPDTAIPNMCGEQGGSSTTWHQILQTCVSVAPLKSDLLVGPIVAMTSVPSICIMGGDGVQNELLWKESDIVTLSLSCEEIFSTPSGLFLLFV